jgi:hypothetical protein
LPGKHPRYAVFLVGSFERLAEGGTAGDQREIDHDRLAAIRAKAAERLEELREEIDRINEEL